MNLHTRELVVFSIQFMNETMTRVSSTPQNDFILTNFNARINQQIKTELLREDGAKERGIYSENSDKCVVLFEGEPMALKASAFTSACGARTVEEEGSVRAPGNAGGVRARVAHLCAALLIGRRRRRRRRERIIMSTRRRRRRRSGRSPWPWFLWKKKNNRVCEIKLN
jgi:hypothetical protein